MEFLTTKPIVQEMLKGLLEVEGGGGEGEEKDKKMWTIKWQYTYLSTIKSKKLKNEKTSRTETEL